jgi:hypothetical protein
MKNLTAKKYAHLEELSAHEIGRPHFRLKNMIVSGLGDFVVQPDWDGYFVAAATATVQQTLFAIARGNPFTITGGATFTKTAQTTSMVKSNELQAPERLLVRAITVYLDNQMNQGDTAAFLSQTLVDFQISTKSFLQLGLAGKAPAAGGAWAQQFGATAAATIIGVTGNGLPSERQGYSLCAPEASGQKPEESFPSIEGILISQQQAFRVIVDPTLAAHVAAAGFTTAAAAAVPAGIGVRAFVYLEGTKARAVL